MTLPLIVESEDAERGGSESDPSVRRWLEHRRELREKLLRHGALLLRGGRALEPSELARFAREFSKSELLDYAGGVSPRTTVGGRGVYTSTEYPPDYTISLHNEMSYTSRWPALLFFHCAVAPASGGETPIADSRRLLKAIDPAVVERFKRDGVMYVRNLDGGTGLGYSWRATFETDDRRAVEGYCRRNRVGFEWKEDGGLRLVETRPATAFHPVTGEEVWFNQADGFHPSALGEEGRRALVETFGEENLPRNARFGDGSEIEEALLAEVRDAMRREMVLWAWREGDILVLDNVLAAHGRMPFTGPRKILLAMA